MICHRCHSDAVVATVQGMPLCWTCTRQVKKKLGIPSQISVVGAAPNQEASFLDDMPGPYSLGKEVGQDVKGTPVDPYGMGKEIGKDAKADGSLSKAADVAKDISSTVKVLAVSAACFGGAFLIYTMWRAHKMQTQAAEFATTHPEIARMALL